MNRALSMMCDWMELYEWDDAPELYAGNRDYRAWKDLCYQGDVHGVRYPSTGSQGAWNVYGGYAPEEMISPGACPGQGPVE